MTIAQIISSVNGSIIHYDGSEYRTSQALLDQGMACCSQCGHILSIFPTANWCSQCGDYVLIITESTHQKPTIPAKPLKKAIVNTARNYDLHEKCDTCSRCLHEKATLTDRCYHKHIRFRYRNRNRLINAEILTDFQFRQRKKP